MLIIPVLRLKIFLFLFNLNQIFIMSYVSDKHRGFGSVSTIRLTQSDPGKCYDFGPGSAALHKSGTVPHIFEGGTQVVGTYLCTVVQRKDVRNYIPIVPSILREADDVILKEASCSNYFSISQQPSWLTVHIGFYKNLKIAKDEISDMYLKWFKGQSHQFNPT